MNCWWQSAEQTDAGTHSVNASSLFSVSWTMTDTFLRAVWTALYCPHANSVKAPKILWSLRPARQNHALASCFL